MKRLAFGAAAAGAALTLTMVRADALALAAVGEGTANNGNYSYVGICNGFIGFAENFNQIAFVVDATGTATATRGVAAGVGTTVTCVVKDKNTGQVFGGVTMGEPGPQAVAAGLVTVNLSSNPEACVSGTAVFSDGGSVTQNPTC